VERLVQEGVVEAAVNPVNGCICEDYKNNWAKKEVIPSIFLNIIIVVIHFVEFKQIERKSQ